jgi:eukaryotic-like serine/threonine-protein kinase
MGLSSGTKLGPYEILGALGAGGMGEVYRAHDTKLNRDVALKVLPEVLAHDPERMARFKREAQVLASLNHPNIATIYGFEESEAPAVAAASSPSSGGVRALAMELVEGRTLAERIGQKRPLATGSSPQGRGWPEGSGEGLRGSPIQVDETLAIAKQIAEALEYAHERGIIHRDLKPANVKVTPEGTVKVLDFGLAKALDVGPSSSVSEVSNSPTLTVAATQAGVIIGTAAYMSPEQARGKAADRRADIWSFGCVMYEMLSGRKPFEGETVTDVLASVVKSEPDWDALPVDAPPRIRELIRRCLVKDPKQRLQAVGDARIAIDETISGAGAIRESPPSTAGTTAMRTSPLKGALPWVGVAILLGLAAVGGWWLGTRSVATQGNWSGNLLPGPTITFWPRVSPDGRLVAFQAVLDDMSQVAVMDPESGNWSVLTHDREHGLVADLSWSSDGSRIYFDRFTSQPLGIYTVPTLGGEAREVLGNAAMPEPLPDGSLLLVRVDPDRRTQIYHFWPDTGKLQAMGAWVSLTPAAGMRVFPDGTEAVFFGNVKEEGSDKSPHLYLLDLTSGTAKRLAPELPIVQIAQMFPLAVMPDGRSILIDLPSGDLHRIVEIPRSGASTTRTLMTLTSTVWSLDAARDGSLYVDQVDRPLQLLRFPSTGGTPEELESLESYPIAAQNTGSVEFSDGRVILPALISGKSRLLLGQPGGNFVPLLQTNEETGPPFARVSDSQVALMIGNPPAQTLTLASVKEGRIIRRFDDTQGRQITELAASPDGKTLYYVSSGSVWSVPTDGGSPKKLCAGDGVAVDPNGKELIVNLIEPQVVRLVRVSVSGGPAQEIHVKSQDPVVPIPLGPEAINHAGKMIIGVVPNDSWFFRLGIMDLSSGAITRVPLNYTGDIMIAAWSNDGRILATADPIRAHIWRFKRVTSEKQ